MAEVPARAWALRLVASGAVGLAIAAVWYFADLSSLKSAREIGATVRTLGEGRLGFLYVPIGFAVGTLLFLPVTALIGGISLTFDPARGFLYSMTGALLGASLGYLVGNVFGSRVVERFSSGPRAVKLVQQLRGHAFRSSLILHLLPVGHFTTINLVSGSVGMPFGWFLLGCAGGLLPGVVFLTFLAGQLPAVLHAPTPLNLLLLGLGVALIVGAGLLLRRWAKRRVQGDAAA